MLAERGLLTISKDGRIETGAAVAKNEAMDEAAKKAQAK